VAGIQDVDLRRNTNAATVASACYRRMSATLVAVLRCRADIPTESVAELRDCGDGAVLAIHFLPAVPGSGLIFRNSSPARRTACSPAFGGRLCRRVPKKSPPDGGLRKDGGMEFRLPLLPDCATGY
jgi:hypothetical protein